MLSIPDSNGPHPSPMLIASIMSQSFGLYFHIPFCIQRCRYCDFATYSKDQIAANQDYVDSLCSEVRKRAPLVGPRKISTIYFGGGTPSLLSAKQIDQILRQTKEVGFEWTNDIEVTMEVNPATLNSANASGYRDAGVNRISIGCQSFDDHYLKLCGREHNSEDSFKTIEIAKTHFDNFSLDLLFSLPEQGLKQVIEDLKIIKKINPPHVSAYCLTLPEKHPFNRDRCDEDEMLEMFDCVVSELKEIELERYEISNFAKPGFESKHNLLYWTDQEYLSFGLSAHSYLKNTTWGTRFWNPSQYNTYMNSVEALPKEALQFASGQFEDLARHEALTDFCHTHFRLMRGMAKDSLRHKFGDTVVSLVEERMIPLINNNLVEPLEEGWALTSGGVAVSNQVFSSLLFSSEDIDKAKSDPIL